MITFESLFEVLRKEKFNQETQKIDDDFYEQVLQYLEEKTAIVETQNKNDSMFSGEAKKTYLQLENAKKIIKDVYEKRENKVVNLAVVASRVNIKDAPTELLPIEKKLYADLAAVLNRYRKGVLENVLVKKKPSVKQEKSEPKDIKSVQKTDSENKLVRFVESVPQFVANDLQVYGPFEQEDMSYLPKKTANLLIQRERAQEVQVENS